MSMYEVAFGGSANLLSSGDDFIPKGPGVLLLLLLLLLLLWVIGSKVISINNGTETKKAPIMQ